ncbi:hypothetical protein DFR79_13239 [Halanaerobium saccharolyticum]|uniref:Uncharacterized protein n=1 Tax=Halanaerobium saccharolyticum TaxID=43595 RepID=A0A4R6LE29_9FIRM|nr:hypothetical protein [Halanaerobium saccharolyticum]TDO77707.1 hypothetical protein DFR79_13239 [Halanaerobium saccharolyticum]
MRIANLTVQIYDKGEWKTLKTSNKNKLQFGIGDEAIFQFFDRQVKVKIVGYDGDNYVIKLGEDNYITAARGQLSTPKKPDELEGGDKIKDKHGNEYKIIKRAKDYYNNKIVYFCRIINDEQFEGKLTVIFAHCVDEIIYD